MAFVEGEKCPSFHIVLSLQVIQYFARYFGFADPQQDATQRRHGVMTGD